KGLALVSGDQRIAADGTFGRSGEALNVTLSNVDLAAVDALMLRPPQFSGRLNATSTISGPKDAPQVQAEFRIKQGGFRQFHYDTFNGTINYGGRGATIDARLQQNPTTWMTAKGYVPVAALRVTSSATPPTHHAPAVREDSFDLHVDSYPNDMGIVQAIPA